MESRNLKNRKFFHFFFIICLILSIYLLSTFKSHYCKAPYGKLHPPLKLEQPNKAEENQLPEERTKSSIDELFTEDEDTEENSSTNSPKPICRNSNKRSDFCDAKGDIRVQSNSNSIFISSTQQQWKIKPYPRKFDINALKKVTEWSLNPFKSQTPNCTFTHSVPAQIFSINGYTGNIFHDFTDILIPLFISSHQFHGQVQFFVSDPKPWWLKKYKNILKHLSKFKILQGKTNATHCFPRLLIGLQFHKELGVDSTKSPSGYSVVDFKVILRQAYGLERSEIKNSVLQGSLRKPRMLIIERKHSRLILNQEGIVDLAKRLGFDVVLGEAEVNTDVKKFAELVNSADVLVGVHGAGLTNMLFLPAGAVLIQILPFGGPNWLAKETFGNACGDLEIKYLEYRAKMEESSLIEEYGKDDVVLKDPEIVAKKGWKEFKQVYLDKQNLRLDLVRLKETFLLALKLLAF